jgi:hypothetical protein
MGLAGPVAVSPPGLDVTVYDSTGLPPLSSGGEKVTVACWSPGNAWANSGGLSAVEFTHVTALEGADSGPPPARVLACTVNAYDVPLVRPDTRMGLADPLAVIRPSVDVTV